MDRETFDRILKAEGIDDANFINQIWNSRPADNLDENRLRKTAKLFKARLPGLLARQALNRALDREYGGE